MNMRYIMTTIEADILIIGGGLVGGTLGCILADQGMSVVLVDREAPSDQMTPEYDGRASAIALGTQRVLEGAGLWDDLKDDSAPIDDIRVTDGDSLMFLHYDHNDMDIRPFGYMVENRRLRVALARRFGSLKKLNVLALDSIRNLDRDAGGVTATLESGKMISAKLAIGADGRPFNDNAFIASLRRTGVC